MVTERQTARAVIWEHRAFLVVLASVCGYALSLLALALSGHSAWQTLGVPALNPHFADTHTITDSWDCERHGVDVYSSTACDPFGRLFNYPRIWLAPRFLGLGDGATPWLAAMFVGTLAVGVALALRNRSIKCGVWTSAAIVSPSIMLGVERGNSDLFVVGLTAIGAALLQRETARRDYAGGAIVYLAAVLKLYPAALLLPMALRPGNVRKRVVALVAIALFAGYALATASDISRIISNTPAQIVPSYGLDVLWVGLSTGYGPAPRLAFLADGPTRLGVEVVAALVLVLVGWLVAKRHSTQCRPLEASWFFWAGASLYSGTFLIGSNFDYKMAALLLCIPDLVRAAARSRVHTCALAAIVGTLWLSRLTHSVFPLDELLNYALFAYFAGAALMLVSAMRAARRTQSRDGLMATTEARA